MFKNYQDLCEMERKLKLIESTKAVLDWDQQCFMPEEASDYRAQQCAYLAGLHHQESVSSSFSDTLKAAEDECSALPASDRRRAHLRKTRRAFDLRTCVPQKLVEELAQAVSTGQSIWANAKKTSDFALFAPALQKLVQLTKKKVQLTQKQKGSTYAELLKEFEFGVSTEFLDGVFSQLKPELISLLGKIQTQQNKMGTSALTGIFPQKAQEELGRALASSLGYDKSRCVLTPSVHPFSTTLGLGDYRITTRYLEEDPFMAFLAIAHEMGHSLYEQGLPKADFGTEIGNAASYGIHESQSLFWEKRIASSRTFLKQWYPKFKSMFPETNLSKLSADDFARACLHVEPSLIRVSADEVTYCLHIIIRFEIEKALMDENLPIEEIPSLWNSKYEHYLGIKAPNDAQGCLQDVHWSCGAFGYFPSYALGHLYSAQFATTFEEEKGSLNSFIEKGELGTVLKWLGDKVHKHGAEHDPLDLITKLTGKPLSSSYFVRYLNGKYLF